jgi:hypothetical protein
LGLNKKTSQHKRPPEVKVAHHSIHSRSQQIPQIKFAPQEDITSFGGLVIFQALFARLKLWERLDACCRHLSGTRQYRHGIALRFLILHMMLGFRELRDADAYADDPMVKRALGLKRCPSVPTLSRLLSEVDDKSLDSLSQLNRELITDRLAEEKLTTLTLDFDGSVMSTKRHAEGTAVGFNKHKKGHRSYYPLICTVAQTGQVFDHLHRSGNVHDSNGSIAFVQECVRRLRETHPKVRIEVRMDSAFFSDDMVTALEALGVEYTISVPFERFVELKRLIVDRKRWTTVPGRNECASYFEQKWKPKCWPRKARFLFVRQAERKQNKEPIQLDLFIPSDHEWQYKVIVTNKTTQAGNVLDFHEGRGYQEKIFGEMKQDVHVGYVPCRKKSANRAWMISSILAHNLGRELQMGADQRARGSTSNRTVRWIFQSLSTIRRNFIQRAGRLIRPQGKLTIIMPDHSMIKDAVDRFLPKAA